MVNSQQRLTLLDESSLDSMSNYTHRKSGMHPISTCLYEQIPVFFLSQSGKYKGHLWSAQSGELTAPINALLGIGYTLLYNNVLSLILVEGLNPYLGNLHRSERKETHLAFDLMEAFRSPVIDSMVLRLVNQRIIKLEDFQPPADDGGVYLNDGARRVFLKQFEARMDSLTTYGNRKDPVEYRRAIQLQVQDYKRAMMAGTAYDPFLRAV